MTEMKKLLLLLLCVPLIGLGQEVITNNNGEKILLNIDGTWEYLNSKENTIELQKGLRFLMNDCIKIYPKKEKDMSLELGGLSKFIHKYPELKVKNFNVRNYEILDLHHDYSKYGHFLLRDNNGITGYYHSKCDNIKVGVEEDTLYSSYDEVINYFEDRNHNRRLNHNPKHPIEITRVAVGDINSVGGVEVEIEWSYLDKENDIKYIEFTFTPYNTVGDIVSGRYHGTSRTLTVTGPLEADSYYRSWSTVFYNGTICCVKIVKVTVTYMDGRSYTYVKEIDKISSPYLRYDCFE